MSRPRRPARSSDRHARQLKALHGWLAVAWAAMIPVAVFTALKNSVPFLVAISVYALSVGHFASWQGSRAEIESNGTTEEDK